MPKIISPLVSNISYHTKNTEDLVHKVQNFRLDYDDEIVLYDVTTLNERTNLNPDQIIELLRFVLTASYCNF